MLSRISLILLLSVVASCTPNIDRKQIVGVYKSKEYSYFQKLLFSMKGEGAEAGDRLKLRNDSTYTLTTCGNNIIGHWKVAGDSLLLFCERNWHFKYNKIVSKDTVIIASVDTLVWSCGTGPETYYISGSGELLSTWYESKISHHDLVRIKE